MTSTLVLAVDVPVDLDEVDAAIDLAKSTGWRVHVVHAAPPEPAFFGYPDMESPTADAQNERVRIQVDALAAHLREHGVDADYEIAAGPTVDVILAAADACDAAIIAIIGRHNSVGHRLLLGSAAASLLKSSGRPVLVLPALPEGSARGINAAVDRLIDVIDRTDRNGELVGLRQAAEKQLAKPAPDDEPDEEFAGGIRDAIHHFETGHPSLTRAINDVAYYLSGMGL